MLARWLDFSLVFGTAIAELFVLILDPDDAVRVYRYLECSTDLMLIVCAQDLSVASSASNIYCFRGDNQHRP